MLEEQYREIRERVDAACRRAGRKPEEVTLIAVSKTKPAEMIQQVYHAGARISGENRVQELLEKEPLLPGDIRWHMIGHLQTNKVRQVVGKACLIHSVDTLHLAEEIQKESAKRGICTDILLGSQCGPGREQVRIFPGGSGRSGSPDRADAQYPDPGADDHSAAGPLRRGKPGSFSKFI